MVGKPKKVAILGAGPTGLSAAYFLQQSGARDLEIDIFDASTQPGGIHQSFEAFGHVFDTGSFVYTKRSDGFSFPNLLPGLFSPADSIRCAVIMGKAIHPFPLTAARLIGLLPWQKKLLFVPHFLITKTLRGSKGEQENLEKWLTARLGPWCYAASGLPYYVPKVMGLAPKDIDVIFARRRLTSIDRLASWRGVTKYAWLQLNRAHRSPALPTHSWALYPQEGGAGGIAKHLCELLTQQGTRLNLGCKVERVVIKADRLEVTGNWHGSNPREYDTVISTIPVTALARLVGVDMGSEPLQYRRLLMIFMSVRRPHALAGVAVLYSYEPHHLWKRVTSYTDIRRTSLADRETALGAEVTLPDGQDPVDETPYIENLVSTLCDEAKLFSRTDIIGISTKLLPAAYPVLRVGCRETMKPLIEDFALKGIFLAGRTGGFDYLGSAQCIAAGSGAAISVLSYLAEPARVAIATELVTSEPPASRSREAAAGSKT